VRLARPYLAAHRFEAVAFCPGYASGLAFIGQYAIIGLSLARENGFCRVAPRSKLWP
jgi:hypothetical protein